MSAIQLNAEFNGIDALKNACREHAIQNAFEFKTLRSSHNRYEIVCKAEDCHWRLYATSVKDSTIFCIRCLQAHSCFGLQHDGNQRATSTFLAEYLSEKLNDQPSYRPIDIIRDIKRDLGVQITYSKAFRAKETAIAKINGSHEASYQMLPEYCEGIESKNPGSIASLEWTSERRFKRIFVCYSASAEGFAYCRPLLGLDGTHLMSRYQGILLAATAVDATGSLFPLSHAVVDAENDDNWSWFLALLRQVISQHASSFLNPGTLTFLSDRQKGLLDGVQNHFPDSPHAYCLRHLEDNFHKAFKHPKLKSLLWKAARATTQEEFDQAIENMNGIDPRAGPWLLSHANPEHWAELYFKGRRYARILPSP